MSKLQTGDFLIRGSDVLAARPDFKLVGRDRDLEKLCGVLLRRSAPNVLLIGPGGVGCSALCIGQDVSRDPFSFGLQYFVFCCSVHELC